MSERYRVLIIPLKLHSITSKSIIIPRSMITHSKILFERTTVRKTMFALGSMITDPLIFFTTFVTHYGNGLNYLLSVVTHWASSIAYVCGVNKWGDVRLYKKNIISSQICSPLQNRHQ